MLHGTDAAPIFRQYLGPLIQAHQIRIHTAIPWLTSVMTSPWTLLGGALLDSSRWTRSEPLVPIRWRCHVNIGPPLYPATSGVSLLCASVRASLTSFQRVCRFFKPSVSRDGGVDGGVWIWIWIWLGERFREDSDCVLFFLWRLVCLSDISYAMVYHSMVRIQPVGSAWYLPVVLGLLPRQQLLCQF